MRASAIYYRGSLYGLSLFSLSLLSSLLSRPACAQTTVFPPFPTPTTATATFTMPQNVDPTRLTFVDEGEMYTHADSASPGDNLGTELTGKLLATNGSAPGGGLELHGLLGGVSGSPPVVDIDLFTTYTGGLRIDSVVPPAFSTSYSPWNVVRIAPTAGYAQGFRFTGALSNQAPMNLNQFFGMLEVTLADPSDPTGFYASTFGAQGFSTVQTTPEPGAIALLSGLAVCGGMLWRKRRR